MSKTIRILHLAALLGLACIAGMYLAAMIAAPDQGLQITGMMELERGLRMSQYYGWFYTGTLLATALVGVLHQSWSSPASRWLVVFLSGASLALTCLPLVYSFLWNFHPSSFENYVGEGLTGLALIIFATSAWVTGGKPESKDR